MSFSTRRFINIRCSVTSVTMTFVFVCAFHIYRFFDRVFIKVSTPTNSPANQMKPVGLLMQRRCFTILRISCHKLEIEIGRYKKIPAESRFCPICKSDNVEDEIHFLTECPAFSVERNVFVSRISKMCKNFTSMSNFKKFIWLFSNENANVLRVFAQFVNDCYCKRFELLSRK